MLIIQNASPPCSEWAAGMNVVMCSALRVPDDPVLLNPLIQPDVVGFIIIIIITINIIIIIIITIILNFIIKLVRWRILHEPNSDLR